MLCAAAMGIFSAGAVTPMWLRDVKISPDGSTIAFTYKGDIYTVPAEGGNATRLTTSGSYEAVPVWSPDGSKIAFASDHHGSTDVFVMPVTGGTVKRLTSYSGVAMSIFPPPYRIRPQARPSRHRDLQSCIRYRQKVEV